MKGVILAGGMGSRLYPLTLVINKHLLPVYNKPMIYYPIETLRSAGITDILIILGGNSVGEFIHLLGDGSNLGVSLTYRYQSKPDGIAGALKLARSFVGKDDVAICLGDNIFTSCPNELASTFKSYKEQCPTGMVFLSDTNKPESFGIATIVDEHISKIIEKPKEPETNYAVTGLYIYDSSVWDALDGLTISGRGEFEITDVNNWYIQNGVLKHQFVTGTWQDAGSIEALLQSSMLVAGI